MNTSILAAVMAGMFLAGENTSATWQSDYSQGQQQGAAQRKPLLVVFGSGPNAWQQVVRDTGPTPEVMQMLADSYVCVYVDTASSNGKRLAQTFDIAGTTGMVISNRSGNLQAFWHQGDISSQKMTEVLHRFADPTVSVYTTETATSNRISFYPPAYETLQRQFMPANCST